jgi:glycosyltransferase involved in cell wall biosynthesis
VSACLAVLQVGPLYNNHLRRWSAHAAALGCSVCAVGHGKTGRRPTDLIGVEHAEVTPEALWSAGDAAKIAWLRDVIRRLRPDLIHAHWLPTWGYFAALAADRPLIVTAWGSDLYLSTGPQRRRADWAMRVADGVLARSGHMRREMAARGVLAERIHEVDLGVDLERFHPSSSSERERLRNELRLPPGPLILSMRAGTALYNLDVVLEAFGIVRERLPAATLVLVLGDAPLSERLRGLLSVIEDADHVRVVGHVAHADMPRYLRAATAAVSIPKSDGSPSSVWEALACGVPLVLSDLPQIEERVGGSGAVTLVRPWREAVASALIDLIEYPQRRRRMARAAREWALANVDEREQIERLGNVYAAMGSRRGVRPGRSPVLGLR